MTAPSSAPLSASEEAEHHLDAYTPYLRACVVKLMGIWKTVGKTPDECRGQIVTTAAQALKVWEEAVEKAQLERDNIKMQIAAHSSEIANIRSQLDDGTQQVEPEPSIAEGDGTLLRTLDALKGTLELWRAKRASRMQIFESLMEVHTSLKKQLGVQHKLVDDLDITTGALEYLQMENDKLQEEKMRRMARAEELLDALRGVCRELGEDSAVAAAGVHPALSTLSAEKESAEVLGSMYRLTGSSGLSGGDDVDLSDVTFEKLQAKIVEMEQLKHEREAQSRDLLAMLGGLWDALNIPEDAPERSMVHKMLSLDRPQRLHKRTLDKCLLEINRLEGCKAQAMRDLALAKARELEQLCISTRISPPLTGPLLAELDKPGQMTQVLSKLVRLIAEVQELARKRAPILAQVQELLAAQADSAWLRTHNKNENRYKGRDATRNLQRAAKAEKVRERLAPMLKELLASLEKWEVEEGERFLYDDQPLQDTYLSAVEAELEQIALEKMPKAKATASTAAAKPPQSRPGSSQSTGAPRVGGPGTRQSTFSSIDRTALTPRKTADSSRRLSLAVPMLPPPSSARDAGIYRSSSGSAKTLNKMARSSDFGTPGSLRAAAEASQAASSSHIKSASKRVQTPPRSPSRGPSTPPSSAKKNSAQALFKRYLGDGCTESGRQTPTKTPGPTVVPPALAPELSFSTVFSVAEDDDGDDVKRAKSDTPKSTATSRTLNLQGAGSTVFSPGAKPSRIPRIRP